MKYILAQGVLLKCVANGLHLGINTGEECALFRPFRGLLGGTGVGVNRIQAMQQRRCRMSQL